MSTAFDVVDNTETDTLIKLLNSVLKAQKDTKKHRNNLDNKCLKWTNQCNIIIDQIIKEFEQKIADKEYIHRIGPNVFQIGNTGVNFKTKHGFKITIGHHGEASATRETSDKGSQQLFVESEDNQAIY